MGFFDFLSSKASAAGRLLVMTPGRAVWTPRNYAKFADEGYSKNVVAYQAINRVADAVATIEWEVWKGNKLIETETALSRLWQQPNPQQATGEFLRAVIGYLLIAGNSYLERTDIGRVPKELWTLRPDRMQVVPGAAGLPQGYIFKKDGKAVSWDVDELTGLGPIKHLKTFNPLNDWYGMSPIEAGAYAIDQHNESMQWVQSLLQNSAKPSGALIMKGDASLGDEQFARLKSEINEQYAGAKNAGRPMLLEGGLEWQQMAISPHEMAILETKFSAARDISLAFGVPPQLLNIPGDNTYSNYKEARLAFYEDTVIPLVEFLLDEVNAWLSPAFNGEYLRPNMDSIPAIAEKRQELWAMADKSADLTINERRAIKGYAPLETVAPGENGNRLLPVRQQGDTQAAIDTQAKSLLYRIAYGTR